MRACLGLAGAAIIAWATRRGIPDALGAAALLIGPVVWVLSRPGWRTARRVVVTDQYIEGTAYGGMRVRLAWDGIGEVQHFVRGSTRRPIRVLRVLSIDRQGDLTFDERLPGFEELIGLVEARIRHVADGTPSSWGRQLWPGPRVGRGG